MLNRLAPHRRVAVGELPARDLQQTVEMRFAGGGSAKRTSCRRRWRVHTRTAAGPGRRASRARGRAAPRRGGREPPRPARPGSFPHRRCRVPAVQANERNSRDATKAPLATSAGLRPAKRRAQTQNRSTRPACRRGGRRRCRTRRSQRVRAWSSRPPRTAACRRRARPGTRRDAVRPRARPRATRAQASRYR
jgi:hypothetical protein